MSSAFFPLGMNNNRNSQWYVPWKGVTPSGTTSGTIRPFTNNDLTNDSFIGFGLPRPMKHARKGRDVSFEQNRLTKSSNSGTLVRQLMDIPGGYTVSQNDAIQTGVGINVVSSNFLNLGYKSEKPPLGGVTSPSPCFDASANNIPSFSFCNPERNARRRAMYASTNLNKNYYNRLEEYRGARCKTFTQNQSQFKNYDNASQYDEVGCPCVVYKPNNQKFSKQGAVSSSTRLLDLNVKTITKNAASVRNVVNEASSNPANTFIYKNKVAQCVKKNCVT